MKKISSINKLASLLLLTVILFACTEEINVKLRKGETRLAVEASVNTDKKKHIIKLKESSAVFYNQDAATINNAIVSVSDGTRVFKYIEKEPGIYQSEIEFAGEVGKTYSLSIKNVDIDKDGNMEEYIAESVMPDPHAVDSIELHFDPKGESELHDQEGPFWFISAYIKDDPDTEDYYGFASSLNGVLVDDTITEVIVLEDTYFNGEDSEGADVGEFFQQTADEVLRDQDEITLETYSLNEDYYDFVTQLQLTDNEDSSFAGSPGNIKTNISNGAVGFFAVYSITRTSLIYKKE